MTPQKALEILNNMEFAEQYQGKQEYTDMLLLCKKALEKQIPKKLDYEGDGYDDKGELIYDIAYCPNCNSRYDLGYDEETNRCRDCGQALNWDGEE